jgi:hypothetical protein
MPFLTLKHVTVRNVNGESITHPPQSVLSDWEVEVVARQKIMEGSEWYRDKFAPLTDREAHSYRVKATQSEPPHVLDEGAGQSVILAPFDDYIGLHPSEITARLRDAPLDLAVQTRRYERAGAKRDIIINYVHPAERPPFLGYDDASATDICDKLELLPDAQVAEAKIYEAAHQNRPLVMTFEKDPIEEPVPA